MTRQTKLGIVVAGVFLAAMGGFYGLRVYRAQAEQPAGEETAQTLPAPQAVQENPGPKQEPIFAATTVAAPAPSEPSTPALSLPPATPTNDGPGVAVAAPGVMPPPAAFEMPKAPDAAPMPVEQPKVQDKPADPPPPAPIEMPKAPDPTPMEPAKSEPKPADAPAPAPVPEPAKPEFKPVDAAPPSTPPAPEPKPTEPVNPTPPPAPVNKESPPPSPMPLPESIASGTNVQPAGGTKLAPKPPPVESFLEEEYKIAANDSFAKISQKFYFSEKYSASLQQYNRDYPVASNNLKQDPPKLIAGQIVWIPPVRILERRYPTLVPGLQPAASIAPAPAAPAAPAASWSAAPAAAPTKPTAKTYRVHDGGETMQDIAKRTLNNANAWSEVYRLNPSLNPGANIIIPAGTLLKLPAEAKSE